MQWTDALGLRVVYHYGLAKAVPLDGSASYAEIATASGLQESLCRRFIRLAMGKHVFKEDPSTKRVRHTAASRRMVTVPGFNDLIGLQLEDIGPASSKLIEAWDKYGQDSGEPNESAFCMYNQNDKSAFAVLARQPERGRRFGRAMHFFTEGANWDVSHVLAAFDWQSLDKPGAVVVDVGGGHGQVSQYLARRSNHIQFVVQDLPHVSSESPAHLPDDLMSRIRFAPHDFFTPQSADPAPTAFLLRFILHNWSDKRAAIILRSLVPAMWKETKVLLYEYILEDEPVTDIVARHGFQTDAIMATFFNAQERRVSDFGPLLAAADERFVLENVIRPVGSYMSLVKVGWFD